MFRNADLEPTIADKFVDVTIWQGPNGVRSILAAIDAEVDAFRKERLHPKAVEEILAITARERRRWTKDGRLPTSGHTSFRRGQNFVYLLLYPPDAIASLSEHPDRIEAWRQADQADGMPDNDPKADTGKSEHPTT